MTTVKERLAGATYDSLDAMMQAYAAEAVRVAAAEHGAKLDYSAKSVAALESILSAAQSADPDLDWLTKLWGSYYGEIFRRRYAAHWTMSLYPNAQFAVPTVEVGASKLYPLLKVNRRLTLGEAENVEKFAKMAFERLDPVHPLAN